MDRKVYLNNTGLGIIIPDPKAFGDVMISKATKQKLLGALREYIGVDLRWSHLAIGVMILAGVAINCLFANSHGWTVWPFIGAAGIMVFIHEAAERNGTGIPPLHVYAFFFVAVGGWLAIVLLLSVVNPLIMLVGIIGLAFYCGRQYLMQRQVDKEIEIRRKSGRCIHCGEIYDPKRETCENCGEEPNPEDTRLARVAGIARANKDPAKARAALTREAAGASAKTKEQALLARARARRPGRKA
jgi:hypothetical protein